MGFPPNRQRKIKFSCHCVRLALRSRAALGQDRRRLNNDKKENKVVMIEKSPMQVQESMPLLCGVLADISLCATMREKSPKPASKDMLFNQDNVILSEVHRKARGQPQWEMYFSDS